MYFSSQIFLLISKFCNQFDHRFICALLIHVVIACVQVGEGEADSVDVSANDLVDFVRVLGAVAAVSDPGIDEVHGGWGTLGELGESRYHL